MAGTWKPIEQITLECDVTGCKESITLAFSPSRTVTGQAARRIGWRIIFLATWEEGGHVSALHEQRTLCPAHALAIRQSENQS